MHTRGELRIHRSGRRLLLALAGLALTLGTLPVVAGATPGTRGGPRPGSRRRPRQHRRLRR